MPSLRLANFPDGVAEILDVGEALVHGGEADVGHLVELAQFLHHHFAQAARIDFALAEPISGAAERLNGFAGAQASAELANRMTAMIGAGIVVTAPGRPADSAAYLARIRLDQVNAAFRAAWAAPGRLVHVAHGRAIDGGEARLAEAWAASQRRPVEAP